MYLTRQKDPSEPLLPPPQREISNQNLGTAGWTRLSKILHTYDETKVKDCKEDIDTLLVFVSLSLDCMDHGC